MNPRTRRLRRLRRKAKKKGVLPDHILARRSKVTVRGYDPKMKLLVSVTLKKNCSPAKLNLRQPFSIGAPPEEIDPPKKSARKKKR